MTAAITTRHGGPEVIEVRHDWPVPRPAPHEVLVRVTAAAVNNTDIWTRTGAYGTSADPEAVVGWRGTPLDFPRIQGADATGHVVAVGRHVPTDLVRRRVVVDPAIAYEEDRPSRILGSEVDGAFAEYLVAPIDRVHDVTDSPLEDAQLACVPIAYATALGMIDRAGCEPGDRVLVTGASGGVGVAAIQLLAARGCEVTAVTSRGKEDRVGAAGAHQIVLRDLPEHPGGDFDVVVDVVGGDGFERRLDLLTDGGRLVTAGAIAGPVVSLDLRRLYLRHRTILGSTMHTPAIFDAVVDLASRGVIRPLVAATYPLVDIGSAQERFAGKDFVGKLVVIP